MAKLSFYPGKISSPRLYSTILHRESLVTKLQEAILGISSEAQKNETLCKIVLLYAPAGYGKTTLLSDFSQHTNIPCCWYFLDHSDNDRIAFLETLLASIRCQFPSFGEGLESQFTHVISAERSRPDYEHQVIALVDLFANTIMSEIKEKFAIFLCNYHEINKNKGINELIGRFLQNMPSYCTLVIESRAIPNLEFATFLARREMFGLSSNAMRFTAQEIHALAQIQNAAPLSDAEAEKLVGLFDGWIAGILLGTRLGDVQFLRAHKQLSGIRGSLEIQIDQQNLFAYIINEVFSREHEIYTFLQEAVVLQEMRPSICSALLSISDAEERLQYLERQGLFVTHYGDGTDIVYNCNSVLRELLYLELQHQSPDRFIELHLRAAELMRASHEYDHAIFHALETGKHKIAAHIIMEAYEELFVQGRIETLMHWIDAVDETILTEFPMLLVIRAKIAVTIGELAHGLVLLDRTSQIIASPVPGMNEDERDMIQSQLAIVRSKALFHSGSYQEAQTLCQQILSQLPADEVILRAEAHTRFGICATLLGDFLLGITHLQKALQLCGRNPESHQVADIHGALANVYSLQGNFALAEHHLSRSMRCLSSLHDYRGQIYNLNRKGLIKQRQGDFGEAEALFSQALNLARNVCFRQGEGYSLINLGDLYQEQGLYTQSLSITEESLAIARIVRDNYLINCALSTLAITYLLLGDSSTAFVLVSSIEILDHDSIIGFERVIRDLVSGTILLYQQQYQEALAYFKVIEAPLNAMGIKREQIQLALRSAECYLAQGQSEEAIGYIQKLTPMINGNHHERLVLIELDHLQALNNFVKNVPGAADLRNRLRLVSDTKNIDEPSPSLSLIPAQVSPTIHTNITHSQLTIRALGEPAVLIDQKLITNWRMARSMELFFFLLNYGRPVRKEQIMTALWPDVDEQTSQTLHSTMHYLRKALGESCITSKSGTYALHFDLQYGDQIWYDVAIFQQQQAKAKNALNNEDISTAQEAFSSMIDLYQGDYVQSFYNNWCIPRRDELRFAYLDARCQLAQKALQREQYDESIMHWQHMLAIDPCMEEAHLGLMRCYFRQGRRGLVLRQYQRCVEALHQELAVVPGPLIQQFYQRFKSSH